MRSNKHLRIFPIDSGNQEKRKVLSLEIDVGFLVILYIFYYYSDARQHIQHQGTPLSSTFDVESQSALDKRRCSKVC